MAQMSDYCAIDLVAVVNVSMCVLVTLASFKLLLLRSCLSACIFGSILKTNDVINVAPIVCDKGGKITIKQLKT